MVVLSTVYDFTRTLPRCTLCGWPGVAKAVRYLIRTLRDPDEAMDRYGKPHGL